MTRTILIIASTLIATSALAEERTYAFSKLERHAADSAADVFFPERLKGLVFIELRTVYLPVIGISADFNFGYHFEAPAMVRFRLTGDAVVGLFSSAPVRYPGAFRATLEAGLDTERFALTGGGGMEAPHAARLAAPLAMLTARIGTLDGLNLGLSATTCFRNEGPVLAAGEATVQVPMTRGVLAQLHGRFSNLDPAHTSFGWIAELRIRFAIGSAATQTRVGAFLTPVIGLVGTVEGTLVRFLPMGGLTVTVRM